jgi:hypothetical protein
LFAIALATVSTPGGVWPPPARAGDRLPEDPAAGAKSTAQWREHMVAEEHERKLRWDRDHLKAHRAVVKFLVTTRARYDRAKTRAAVTAIRTRLPMAVDGVRKQITRIDHWGTNSNLLEDYDVLLKALSDAYPAARIAFLDGDHAALDAQKADFDRCTKHINDWLAEAAEAQDE